MKVCVKGKIEDGVMFEFANGNRMEAVLEGLGEAMVRQLAIHGLSQKIGDSYAGSESVDAAEEAARGTLRNLQAGLWGIGKMGAGGKMVEALVRATGREREECLQLWTSAGKQEQKALRAHPDVKLALAEMEMERAKGLKGAGNDGKDLNDLFS